MVVLAFGLELKKTCYLQLSFTRDILDAGEIKVIGKLSDVDIFSKWIFCFGPEV